jgi:hypothetical protein
MKLVNFTLLSVAWVTITSCGSKSDDPQAADAAKDVTVEIVGTDVGVQKYQNTGGGYLPTGESIWGLNSSIEYVDAKGSTSHGNNADDNFYIDNTRGSKTSISHEYKGFKKGEKLTVFLDMNGGSNNTSLKAQIKVAGTVVKEIIVVRNAMANVRQQAQGSYQF